MDNFQLKNWIFLSYHTVVYWLFPTPQVILLLILLYYLINKLTVQLLKLCGNHRSINEQFDSKIRKFHSFRNYFTFTLLKFIFSEKATKFFRTSTIDLTVTTLLRTNLRWRFRKHLWPVANFGRRYFQLRKEPFCFNFPFKKYIFIYIKFRTLIRQTWVDGLFKLAW